MRDVLLKGLYHQKGHLTQKRLLPQKNKACLINNSTCSKRPDDREPTTPSRCLLLFLRCRPSPEGVREQALCLFSMRLEPLSPACLSGSGLKSQTSVSSFRGGAP